MTIYQFPAERRNEKGAMPGLQTQAADLQARPEEALLSLLFARLTLKPVSKSGTTSTKKLRHRCLSATAPMKRNYWKARGHPPRVIRALREARAKPLTPAA
jgi:hypothetical protein